MAGRSSHGHEHAGGSLALALRDKTTNGTKPVRVPVGSPVGDPSQILLEDPGVYWTSCALCIKDNMASSDVIDRGENHLLVEPNSLSFSANTKRNWDRLIASASSYTTWTETHHKCKRLAGRGQSALLKLSPHFGYLDPAGHRVVQARESESPESQEDEELARGCHVPKRLFLSGRQ
ncbi:hypothetical protein G7046_g7711 [Stylonectria norvegica]|nr:hypothetical protein G7046_g7711 [Stylonectria norvegica]